MIDQNFNKMRARAAVTLLECVVALSLLAVGFVLTIEVLTACTESRRASQTMLAAQLEASNIAERIAAMAYVDVTPSAIEKVALSPGLLASLPEAKLLIEIFPSSTSDVPHKRVKVEISWPSKEETPIAVRLTTWRYPAPKEGLR